MNQELLKIENLSVEYRANKEIIKAVNNISLSINKGETVGLVGETGAGKTTAALSILRLLPQNTGFITNGSIKLEGKNLLDLTEQEMRLRRGVDISMIFQDPMTSLNPVINIGEQIEEILYYHNTEGLSKKEMNKRVDEMLELVGISKERKKEFPHQFSGGMKQRVSIAMALTSRPKLLIADEPTTALDVTIQAQVLKMMDELKDKMNTSLLLITHDLGVVARMCQKVAIMYAGEIIEYGTARDVYKSKEKHPYTEGLFNSIPDISKKTKRLNIISGLMPDPTKLPKGCSFAPRCNKKMDICDKVKPEDYIVGTHQIKCHLFSQRGSGEIDTDGTENVY